mmetsp:Transcript_89190/g.238933  ORF Transcript_89190/g.238933 Transcript_89190/m.238933 type:complete len:258 (-) Transcript_89190:4407-5180(-)
MQNEEPSAHSSMSRYASSQPCPSGASTVHKSLRLTSRIAETSSGAPEDPILNTTTSPESGTPGTTNDTVTPAPGSQPSANCSTWITSDAARNPLGAEAVAMVASDVSEIPPSSGSVGDTEFTTARLAVAPAGNLTIVCGVFSPTRCSTPALGTSSAKLTRSTISSARSGLASCLGWNLPDSIHSPHAGSPSVYGVTVSTAASAASIWRVPPGALVRYVVASTANRECGISQRCMVPHPLPPGHSNSRTAVSVMGQVA